ncbi:hypothetical protein QYE76_019803 [Lolium multiflorum]|uniref:Transposase (putative) gypsy type domain-containing protein n=1 Tax=Lolium multiflorum TaxID=4521 RepID=A0AAD8VQR2_LOLMU|nr:hypothetical protein QYE76_019803 [Lolium multiflorum]
MSSEESVPDLSAGTQFSESPETSGEEVPVDQPDDGLEEDLAQHEEEAGGSKHLTGNDEEHAGGPGEGADANFPGIDLDAYTRGAWMGSDVTQAEIDWLYRSRRIPEEVFCRIPGQELKPAPQPGEYVVFAAHFERGLGLPVLDFFRDFLDFYELQPHHLPGNSIFYLSSFTAFMEGYTGITPSVDNFSYFYYLRKNSIQDTTLSQPKPFVRCGGCILSPRQGSVFYKLTGLESVRTWQKSFFYVRNGGPEDFINLLGYVPGPPAMTNWLHNPKDHKESKRVANYINLSKEETNLSSDDIVRSFLSRRVLPLQRRAHKMSQISGQRDPTRITTFSLSPKDLILKAKQIYRNTLRPDGKYGLKPYSRNDPPPRDNFARIATEELPRYAPKSKFPDDADPDPYVRGPHQMGPTQSRRPASHSATPNPQVLEHVAPLAAQVGSEFEQALAQGQAPKNKAPAEDAGPSGAPPAKRQKKGSLGPHGRKRRHEMPTAAGAPLVLTRSAPGMPPEASEDPARTSPPPRSSPARPGAGKAPSSLRGGNTNSGCAAPNSPDHRAEEDFISPPEFEDTGAGNMGTGTEDAGRSEPLVPPVLKTKKKKKTTASPSNPLSENSAPAAPSPAKDTPTPPPAKDAPAPPSTRDAPVPPPAKDAPAAPPAPPAGKSTLAPPPTPEGTITAQQLTAAVTAATAPPSGSQGQSLVLHAGRVSAGEKASAQLGRIVQVTRGEVDLGGLRESVEKWNRADLSPATCGLGKDKLPVVDNSGPRSTAQHLSRLKRAVKEFDTAWHDASANVVGTLDARKQLFEGLLWEYRDLSKAFSTLEQAHDKCRAALPETSLDELTGQISALKAEKEKLALEHSNALEAHRTNFGELKQKLIQGEVQHAEALKEAKAAGEAKVKEVQKELVEATGRLQKELEDQAKALKEAQDRNATLLADQAEFDRLVAQADNHALKLFPDSPPLAHKRVMELRTEQGVADPEAAWSAYDHLVALYARITHMKVVDRHLGDVPEVALQVFKFLWPEEAAPEDLTGLAQRLKDAGQRFSEWKRSSARAEADTALRVACSWYDDLDLNALHSMRADAPTNTDPAKAAKRRDRAYRIAHFVSTSTFIPPPADIVDEIS